MLSLKARTRTSASSARPIFPVHPVDAIRLDISIHGRADGREKSRELGQEAEPAELVLHGILQIRKMLLHSTIFQDLFEVGEFIRGEMGAIPNLFVAVESRRRYCDDALLPGLTATLMLRAENYDCTIDCIALAPRNLAPSLEHQLIHGLQNLLVSPANASGVKILTDFVENVGARGIVPAGRERVRIGFGLLSCHPQLFGGPPADEHIANDRFPSICGTRHFYLRQRRWLPSRIGDYITLD